jgi:hypothetical protein
MADESPKPDVKHIVVTRSVGVCDRGEKAEPAWRSDSKSFVLNDKGRAG